MKKRSKFRVGVITRGELGFLVLQGLLKNPDVEVAVIVTCNHSPEIGSSKEDFERVAGSHSIPFYFTNNINKEKWGRVLADLNLDVVVAMLWVNTISAEIIQKARKGFLNLHGGLLPRYRGNACANWALLNREKYHGITVHLMDGGNIDNGPIVLQKKFPITSKTVIKELMDLNTSEGSRMVLEAIELIRNNRVKYKKQNEKNAMYCYPRLPRDGEIDWNMAAEKIELLVRAAGEPYPGAYSYFADVRDSGKIKKMVIHVGHIERHQIDFSAVPGHLLRLDGGKKWGIVCGNKRLLVLDRINIEGKSVAPSEFFKTVRQRFGLDTATLLELLLPSKNNSSQI